MSIAQLDSIDILTMDEAAELHGVSTQAMRKAATRGRLRARKVGRQWLTTRQALSVYVAMVAEARRAPGLGGGRVRSGGVVRVVDLADGRLAID